MTITSTDQFKYAEHNFNTSEYFRAIGEYKRFIYFFPNDERVEAAMFKIGLCYYLSNRYKDAINSFNDLIRQYKDSQMSIKAYFMVAESFSAQNEYGDAVNTLLTLTTVTDDQDVQDEANYKISWIFIETASWDKAREYLDMVSTENRERLKIIALSNDIGKEPDLPYKNPTLAGGLAIFPGAGYVYCERYQDAFMAFLINAGLIWAAYESFNDENYALGSLITFVELGFYTGQIYGSVASAHKYNKASRDSFIENLKRNTKIRLSANPENKGVVLSFKYSF